MIRFTTAPGHKVNSFTEKNLLPVPVGQFRKVI